MGVAAFVFDAYGTLFDVAGAARQAAAEPGGEAIAPIWPRIAEDWRRKQLEYTWLRTITCKHCDFEVVTADGLDWALEASGVADDALRARLLALYDALPAYPEVPDVLDSLARSGMLLAILSNGSPGMLARAVAASGLEGRFDAVLSVEDVGVFKPDARVYRMATQRFECAADRIVFVSANGWDVAGAAGFGFRTVWVNRSGLPVDRLPHRPWRTLTNLRTLAELARI